MIFANSYVQSVLKLFKALPLKDNALHNASMGKMYDPEVLQKTIKRGFVFAPEVYTTYTKEILLDIAGDNCGLTPEEMNNSFHKSWHKVANASMEQLFVEQIIHYFTTYGYEALGIHDSAEDVYIPNEKLEIPKIDMDSMKLSIIKGYTDDEIRKKVFHLLESGIALKSETIDAITEILMHFELSVEDISRIKNKEVCCLMYHYADLVPKDPVEFLRYVVYMSTHSTLLIKSPEVIDTIKNSTNNAITITGVFRKYDAQYGFKHLAEIFYRFKPIFLAYRFNSPMKTYINKIRKLAVMYHKPMKQDFLNNVTSAKNLDMVRLHKELDKVNVFRKIRLAYALKYRVNDCNKSIMYRIRNGKSWATSLDSHKNLSTSNALTVVLGHIAQDIEKNVKDKKIFIPEYITYTLPSTEKQFTGNFPSGSCVEVDQDMIFGIHWNNVKRQRIDLDLSIVDMKGRKIGWDGLYRSDDRTILFSGDMTDASGKNGASELFYISHGFDANFIVFLNYYNYMPDIPVPFDILIAKQHVDSFGGRGFGESNQYMVDPNTVLAKANSLIDNKSKVLGFGVMTEDKCKFYFAETYMGRGISSSESDYVRHGREYLVNHYTDTINLKHVLEMAGAVMSTKEEADIDLSPESLEKDSIINLLV